MEMAKRKTENGQKGMVGMEDKRIEGSTRGVEKERGKEC